MSCPTSRGPGTGSDLANSPPPVRSGSPLRAARGGSRARCNGDPGKGRGPYRGARGTEALATHTETGQASAKMNAPRASVTAGGGTARLGLTMDLPYPIDVSDASRHVQQYVSERVAQLTGMRVTECTLDIAHLVPAEGLGSRRVK